MLYDHMFIICLPTLKYLLHEGHDSVSCTAATPGHGIVGTLWFLNGRKTVGREGKYILIILKCGSVFKISFTCNFLEIMASISQDTPIHSNWI